MPADQNAYESRLQLQIEKKVFGLKRDVSVKSATQEKSNSKDRSRAELFYKCNYYT